MATTSKTSANPCMIDQRIEAGTGDDHDTGRVTAIDGEQVTVAWDSGVETTQHYSTLLADEGTPYAESVIISDDSGQRRYDAGEHPTVEACIADYYRGRCRTVTDVREHLESADGYGYIEVDGERVLDVRP